MSEGFDAKQLNACDSGIGSYRDLMILYVYFN